MGNPMDPVSALTGGTANSQGKKGGPGDFIGDITGANAAARAAGDAAKAREAELRTAVGMGREGLKNTQRRGDQATSDALGFTRRALDAANSPEELRALTGSLQQQETALGRQADLFASIDPAIMEASNQALSILRGEDSAQSTGVAKRRDRERQKLVDRLREQLGPGAETSTAGMQALNQFDAQTETLQQDTLGSLFGMAQQGAQGRGALNQSTANLANIGGMFGSRANRLSNAQFTGGQLMANTRLGAGQLERGGFSDLMNAQSGLAAGAGSEHVEGQLRAQAKNQFINDRIQAGENMAASAMGSAGGMMGGCFPFGTKVDMENGTKAYIEDLKIGMKVLHGGEIVGLVIGKAGFSTEWFDYEGVKVAGDHAVQKQGKWVRIKDADGSMKINKPELYKINLITANHLIHINGVMFADMQEVEDHTLSYDESLEALNASA